MPRILIHEPNDTPEDCVPRLAERGREVVACPDRRSLVAALAEARPDVLVYVITELAADIELLRRLRTMAPQLPIILLGGPTDLASRRAIQELRPTYYGVFPLEVTELNDAVRGALHRAGARS